jgi:hypothetical protein
MRILLTTALLALTAGPLVAQDSASTAPAQVTYISGPSYYISRGRQDGLLEGSDVFVIRGDSSVARLRVQYLSSHQSVCVLVEGDPAIKVGDQIRFTAVVTAQQATPDTIRTTSRPPGPPGAGSLHGRVGARYLMVKDGGAGVGYGQPAADVRLDGDNLGGSGIGLNLDFRARQTTSTLSNGANQVDGRARAYEANIFWQRPSSPVRFAIGRQYSQSISAVNLFDGGVLELRKPSWGIGAFGGTQPDPDLNFSTDTKEFGGFVGIHSRPATTGVWAVTTGVVGSYFQGKADREFGYLQASFSNRQLSFYGSQELDYYRPWKVDAGEKSPFSLTSTFLTANVRLSRLVNLFGGYDTRRNVRLYRDVVNPVTQFDDEYRQGAWGGIGFSGARWRIGADGRSSFGGPSGTATSYTGTAGLYQLTSLGLGVNARVTRYTNPRLDGWLYALGAGMDIAGPLHLELNGGLRKETEPLASPTGRSISWFGADLDVPLGRSWYLLLSGNRENGDGGHTDQFYSAITWRF